MGSHQRTIHGWQINLHHAHNASLLLRHRLEREKLFVALLQEPLCWKSKVQNVPRNARLHAASVDGTSPRAAILVSKSLHSRLVPQYSNRDTVTVACDIMGRNGHLRTVWWVASYMPGDSAEDPPPEMVRSVVDYCNREKIPLLLGCDANAHNQAWGSTNDNPRGVALLEYIIGSHLVICNKGHEPTFVTQNRREVLDLTLTAIHSVNVVENWRVDPEPSLSDHRCIRFDITFCAVPQIVSYRNREKTDWTLFTKTSQDLLQSLTPRRLEGVEEIEEMAQGVTSALTVAIDKACPVRPVKLTFASDKKVWWNAELQKLRSEARRAFRLFYRTPSEDNWLAYQRANGALKRETRRAKRGAWRNFCEQNNSLPHTARLVKLLKKDKDSTLESVQKPDGSYTSSGRETLEVMMEKHYPGSVIPHGTVTEPHTHAAREVRNLDGIVNTHLVQQAVNSFKPLKAAGCDMVFPKMLQKAGQKLICLLVELYKACLRFAYVPESWRHARSAFIPKPRKDSYMFSDSFRPITLTSFFLKGLERLVIWDMYRSGIIERLRLNQYAYKAGTSTETALHHLVARIEKSVFRQQFALGVFLDLVGAFSNINHDAIRAALEHFGVQSTLAEWLMFMLRNQTVTATLQGDSITVLLTRGTPHGGVASPIIFIMVVDEVLRRLSEIPGLVVQAYADDIVLLAAGIDVGTIRSILQRSLKVANNWARSVGLSFSSRKSKAVMFTWKRKWSMQPLTLGADRLNLSDTVVYLGVTLHRRLSWTPHILERIAKAKACLVRCGRIVGKTWGISPKCTLWIYSAIIRPMVAYAATIWSSALDLVTVRHKLTQLQRLACVHITSAFPGTPTAALEMLIGLPSLDVFLKGEAALSAYRMKCNSSWKAGYIHDTKAHKSHVNVCNAMITEIRLLALPSDVRIPGINPGQTFSTYVGDGSIACPEDTAACFTDGSKLDSGSTGAAVYFPSLPETDVETSAGLGTTASVFQAEVHAISMAANLANRYKDVLGNRDLSIYSDSQAAIKSLTKIKLCSKVVSSCIEELNNLSLHRRVCVTWVKAHVGTHGNEMADSLAKKAAANISFTPEPIIPVPHTSCSTAVRSWVGKGATKRWTEQRTCRHARSLFPTPVKPRGAKKLLSLDRRAIRHVIQILSGHGNMAKYRHTTGHMASPLCPQCGLEVETPQHLVEICPVYQNLRSKFLDGVATSLSCLAAEYGTSGKTSQDISPHADVSRTSLT